MKQKLFWKQKKTNWRKMSKTSKSCKSRHWFPNGCDIFQQEKAWSWHFPESFNCDSFCGGRKNKFSLPNLECPSHLHWVLFTMGFLLIWELCWCHEILPHRMGTARFPRAFQQQEQHRQHLLKSRMGLSLLSGLAKPSTAFKASKQWKSTLTSVGFHWLPAKQPKALRGLIQRLAGIFSLIPF